MPTMSERPKTTARRPHFRRHDPPPMRVTDDDVAIIRAVATHRFLRATDIFKLRPRSYKKLTERLAALYHNHYLDRPRAQLEYYTPTSRAAYVYALGNKGATLLAELDGVEPAKVDWTDKNREASRPFIRHTLLIADVMIGFELATRAHPSIKLMTKSEILARAPEATRRASNPLKWTADVTVIGQRQHSVQRVSIVPDQLFGLDFTAERKRAYFLLEADTARMPVARSTLTQSSVQKKLLTYYHGHQARQHTDRFGIQNFRVLTLTTTRERVLNMIRAVKDITGGRGSNLFLFADTASFNASANVLSYEYLTGKGEPVLITD